MKKFTTSLLAILIVSATFFKSCDDKKDQLIAVLSVALNQTSITMSVGSTITLVPTILPENASNPALTWASTDTTVATVVAGTVTAIARGTTTIMAISVDGGRTASTTVTVTQPPTSVTLNQTAATIDIGNSITLLATVLPENAANKNVTWSSSNPSVAMVTNGVVTAVSTGTATITVTTEDGGRTATCAITVTATGIPVTSVSLNQTTATLALGSTLTLTATVLPENATNKNVTWSSSNPNVATVINGVVTAVSIGTTTITVTTQNGNRTATCAITVSATGVAVTGITLNQQSATILIGDTLRLIHTIEPANATNRIVAWTSSNNAVATVNSNGVITALTAGTTMITVTTQDGNRTATCAVVVTTSAVTDVTLNQTTASLFVGGTVALIPTILPENATNKNVTWSSSNPAVATVNNNGVVTAVSVGTATITVTTQDGNRTATCVVTVNPVSVTEVTLNQTTATIFAGDTLRLTATILPANATNRNVTWSSSNTAVATVTDGRIIAIAPGTATITVTTQDGNRTATCEITVVPVPVTGVVLNQTTATVPMGTTLTLTPTVLPSNATNKNVTWQSSNTNVATVLNGIVTPVTNGTATITVTTQDGERTATCAITVITSVASVSLNHTAASLTVNETLTLTPTVLPETASNKTVTWTSSNTTVATVANGVVTARALGTATITATTQDGNRTATCVITVRTPVTGVTLNRVFATLGISESLTLVATVQPANATNTNVTWTSSNPAVATVSSTGVVTAISQGTATITATTVDGNFTATCEMTIIPIPVTGVTLSHTTFSLQPGFTHTLTATIAPANATNKNVTWTSSNPSVATVNSNGMIVAMSYGWTTITATTQDGNHVATCYLVVGVPVTSITLNQTTARITDIGNTLTLIATVLPVNATSRGVIWTSSNPAVATVGSTGVVTAVAWGVATITATTEEGNRTATCVVTVGWGTVSFATTQTWTIPAANGAPQTIWSDAVQTSFCSNKTSYNGVLGGIYNIDCRSNPDQKGDLFSWRAVNELKDHLCPHPWRVPTQQDFIDLDIALGGTGQSIGLDITLLNRYLNIWGGNISGHCGSDGSLPIWSEWQGYWSQTEYDAHSGILLYFDHSGQIIPQYHHTKSSGLALRCVR